jgi:hypothetical protein
MYSGQDVHEAEEPGMGPMRRPVSIVADWQLDRVVVSVPNRSDYL